MNIEWFWGGNTLYLSIWKYSEVFAFVSVEHDVICSIDKETPREVTLLTSDQRVVDSGCIFPLRYF